MSPRGTGRGTTTRSVVVEAAHLGTGRDDLSKRRVHARKHRRARAKRKTEEQPHAASAGIWWNGRLALVRFPPIADISGNRTSQPAASHGEARPRLRTCCFRLILCCFTSVFTRQSKAQKGAAKDLPRSKPPKEHPLRQFALCSRMSGPRGILQQRSDPSARLAVPESFVAKPCEPKIGRHEPDGDTVLQDLVAS